LADKTSLSFEETLAYDHVEILPGSLVSLTLQREATALGSPIRFRIHVTTFDAACRIADSNIAIAVVPLEVASIYEKVLNIKAIPLIDSWATRNFVVCIRDYSKLSVPARSLFDHLTKLDKNSSTPAE
jgi:DNA-binding transcriptional LysR family regulator